MSIKHELQNIISGNASVKFGKNIQTIKDYIRTKKAAIPNFEKSKFSKEEEREILNECINQHQLEFNDVDFSKYIGEGAEQKIYEFADPEFVLKLNSSVFYLFWDDYFNSLLIHNYFFPQLAYELMGFITIQQDLYAVVKQPFVVFSETTNLSKVKEFLNANGFINKKNNDYFNPELGIILEDLHDENVLTSEGVLHFIDTVFFLTNKFFDTNN